MKLIVTMITYKDIPCGDSRLVLHTDMVPEYSLPFSKEVGERANPTLDAMRAIVVHGRKRPKIPDTWKTHEVILFMY